MKRSFLLALLLVAAVSLAPAKPAKSVSAKKFDAAASAALQAMESRADQLHIAGVAVVSFSPGDSVQGWYSRMAVAGRLTDPKASANGNNLLGIAYAKAAEMARTLKDSGTSGGAPMTGEFGWQGGVVARVPAGYVIIAFSGGKSEDDVDTSRAGLAAFQAHL